MRLVSWMQPRSHHDAARTMGLLLGVAIAVTVVTVPVSGAGAADSSPILLAFALIAFLAVIGLAIAARYLSEADRLAWAMSPLLAIAANTLIGLGTQDASIGAQIFFVFCAVYGGALLTSPGAVMMAVSSVLGEAVLVFAQLPVAVALNNLVYLSATLVTTSYLLARNAQRIAVLVDELERRASTDSLTGLVTRRKFDLALERAVADRGPWGASLILLDIDRFKAINDEFGHPGGDEVLVQLSDLITSMARENDVVCRLGGDEMAVLMPRCSVDVGAKRANEMIDAVRRYHFRAGPASAISVSVSAGVAHCPVHATAPRQLYSVADAALYEAKRGGRDRVVQHAT